MTTRLLSTQRIVNIADDPATGTAGEIYYNTTNNVLRYHNGTAWTDFFATQIKHLVKNDSGVTLNKGTVVYTSGANGTNILVKAAQAYSDQLSAQTLGFLESTLDPNDIGYVVTNGLITGINTSSASAGSAVWLSPTTAGGVVYGLANKPKAPDHLVYLGVVTRSNTNNGEIFVHISNGWEIEELHDVRITNPTNNQVLSYASASNIWINKDLIAGGGSVTISETAPAGSTTGQLWFNSSNGSTYVYYQDVDSSQWIEVIGSPGPPGMAEMTTYVYTSASGQTTFSGLDNNGATLIYQPKFISVYLNGNILNPSQYTATTGTSIVLNSSASVGSTLIVTAFSGFDVANTYSIAQADGKFLTMASASATYLTQTSASNIYVTKATASGYLTTSSASATYLTQSSASTTYALRTPYQSASPSYLINGQLWVDSDNNNLYVYNGSSYVPAGGAGATGGGNDKVFYENDQVVASNYTITAGKNAMSTGPITINSGVTVTIPSGSVWVII